jgi:hypothetical protein
MKEPLGTSGRKEEAAGAAGAAGEQSPRGSNEGWRSLADTLGWNGWLYSVRPFGTNSLKVGAM